MSSSGLHLLKLGGSLITDKAQIATAHPDRIDAWAREIAYCQRKLGIPLLIGHGSGSFGHAAARKHRLDRALKAEPSSTRPLDDKVLRGIGETQHAARVLHQHVIEALLKRGVRCYSLAASSFLVSSGPRTARTFADPAIRAVQAGLVPVVYGDVVMETERGFSIASTESIFIALAKKMRQSNVTIEKALWMGDTPGVYDASGEVIESIDRSSSRRALAAAGGVAAGKMDVTGGMKLRVESALALARLGIESWILDGRKPNVLRRTLRNQKVIGTQVT